MMDQPTLLNTEEAARFLRVSPRTLERYRVTGEGPRYRKVRHRVCYTPEELVTWLNGCTRNSTSDPGPGGRRPDGRPGRAGTGGNALLSQENRRDRPAG